MNFLHCDMKDYDDAVHLFSQWLSKKHNMTYKAFCNKSKHKRDDYRAEYRNETGNDFYSDDEIREYEEEKEAEEQTAYMLLAESGVPFDPFGEPIGIGYY